MYKSERSSHVVFLGRIDPCTFVARRSVFPAFLLSLSLFLITSALISRLLPHRTFLQLPLSCVGQKGKLMNVLHVLTITQNLVSIGQIVGQDMVVRFTHLGAFIEEEGRIIARGHTERRMFILDRTDNGPNTALFTKGQKAESDIALWHKRIGHINYRRLQDPQTKQVVFGLPKFSGRKAQICEACQLGKQHRLPFP
jgi:hypothetical protein